MKQNVIRPPHSREMERWVHLDLKGAPPLVGGDFWSEWCSFLVTKGSVTGLVIEFEDVLPITVLNELAMDEPAKRRHVYSCQQAALLIGTAQSKGAHWQLNYEDDASSHEIKFQF